MREQKERCRQYHWKNRDKILKRKRYHYTLNKIELNQKTIQRHKRNVKTWEGYIPKVTQCQMCGKDIFFNQGSQKKAIHFDHRNSGIETIRYPMAWLEGHRRTLENQEIWEKCNFGMLCVRCNLSLPTIDRKQHVFNAVKYVLGFKTSYLKLEKSKCHKPRINGMNSGKPRTGNPEPSSQSEKVQRLLGHSDMLNNQISVPQMIKSDDIVRTSKELEKNRVMATTQLHKEVLK